MSICSQVGDHVLFVAELGVVVGLTGTQIIELIYVDLSRGISHSFNKRRGVILRIPLAIFERL